MAGIEGHFCEPHSVDELKSLDEYALRSATKQLMAAPELPYRPPKPRQYHPGIALVGCGGISAAHCDAYRTAGFPVTVLCDRNRHRAEARRDEYFPDAEVATNINEVLARPDIHVVDITTHAEERPELIQAALESGRHVLSQKPFVLDLDHGQWLCELADRHGVRLAVNQNGRWAPHLSWMRAAVHAGLVGDIVGVHVDIHWDHSWVHGTPFATDPNLILFDFGIHWFDFVSSLLPNKPVQEIFAIAAPASNQRIEAPLLASALLRFDGGQGSLVFDAATGGGSRDHTVVAGTAGVLESNGPDLGNQSVRLETPAGVAVPELTGNWFNDGFAGAMGELLCAIEESRMPSNSAHANLRSLALCFAAVESARTGVPVRPGAIRQLPRPSDLEGDL